MKKFNKVIKWTIIVLALIIICSVGGFYIYTLDYYRADASVDGLISDMSTTGPLSLESVDNFVIAKPAPDKDLKQGIVFYPGGKVEAKAYQPLLLQLSALGYTTVLVEMPMNLAVFNVKGALKAKQQVPDIQTWYIAGHSLGGAMASSLMEDYESEFSGLILMGAYPINDAKIPTLALYGTYDIMLNLEEVVKADKVVEIVNGNHAQFGNYGPQEGDGTAQITREEQQIQAVLEIDNFIQSLK